MQVQLSSDPTITLAAYKTAAKKELHSLDDVFLNRELEFLGCSRATFDLKAAEAIAYRAAAYPTPLDGSVYPYLALEVELAGYSTAADAADALYLLKGQYDRTVEITERTRLGGFAQVDGAGYLEDAANKLFAFRDAFGLSAVMGATLNKSYVTPAPNPDYPTVEVTGDGVDTLTITLPAKSLADDLEVIVEAYGAAPWGGSTLVTHTNPGASIDLTFTDPTDPAYDAIDIQWLVTIRNIPRVSQQFIVDSTTH